MVVALYEVRRLRHGLLISVIGVDCCLPTWLKLSTSPWGRLAAVLRLVKNESTISSSAFGRPMSSCESATARANPPSSRTCQDGSLGVQWDTELV